MDEQLQQNSYIAQEAAPPVVAERFPQPQPGRAGRYARLLLRRLLYAGMLIWQALSPRLGWVLAIVFLLGVIGFQSLLLIVPRLSASSGGDSRAANLPPSAAVEAFIEGQARYDADLMWDALSPQLQEAMADRGASRESLVQQTESERAAGQRYSSATYIGGIPLENSRRRYFYVIDVASPTPDRDGLFTFIFTTDREGKILDLKMGN
jgi:hypothetical protein